MDIGAIRVHREKPWGRGWERPPKGDQFGRRFSFI